MDSIGESEPNSKGPGLLSCWCCAKSSFFACLRTGGSYSNFINYHIRLSVDNWIFILHVKQKKNHMIAITLGLKHKKSNILVPSADQHFISKNFGIKLHNYKQQS